METKGFHCVKSFAMKLDEELSQINFHEPISHGQDGSSHIANDPFIEHFTENKGVMINAHWFTNEIKS